ncbi:unnamed protein product [Cuscuta epithymum]|uniref:Uncharacterized protein n=1 Tax=Cuscuta epithymum TaxID=186058 RepID=A0AAV0DPD8_9ASTE|nr:unnamed protein product [Cuscuta epithymum]
MHDLCMVDGFVDITNNLGDMIKYLANEPSVGLFYIQQHTHNAIPNLVNLNRNVVEKSHEVILHMEDLEDSITVMRSMKVFGFPIAEEMNRDIKYSLAVMTASQPKKGLLNINIPRGSFGIGSVSTSSNLDGSDNNSSYLSSVLKSARRKASSFKWAQLETKVPSSPTVAKASTDQLLSFSSKFEEFRATREAELEEWLEGGRCDQ